MCDIDPRDVETWNTKSSSHTGGGGSQPGNGSNSGGNGGNNEGSKPENGTMPPEPNVGLGPFNIEDENTDE